jgi:RNA polymerase sigma-70 factor, ECF subfamily
MRLDPRDTRSDLQLLKLSRKGDRDAFGQLARKHYRGCVNVATSILRDRTEAEDEVQQALWKAFEHLDQYLGEAEFFTWLARIVANECRMLLRSKKRARFVYLSNGHNASEDRHPELLSPASDPEYQALNCEMINVLRAEIRHVPPLFREVIQLRDVEELPMSEVAFQLGITVSAAKSRLLRARIELRKRVTLRFRPARHVVPLLSKRTLPARHVQRSGFAA